MKESRFDATPRWLFGHRGVTLDRDSLMPLSRKIFFSFSIEESRNSSMHDSLMRDSSMENKKNFFLNNGIKESRFDATP